MSAALPIYRLWIAGKWEDAAEKRPVFSPYTGKPVASTCQADPDQLERALEAAATAFHSTRKLSSHARSRLLSRIAAGITEKRKELVDRMVREAGKPAVLADVEVNRAIVTFTLGAEEAKRMTGEVIPVDLDAGGRAFGPAVIHWVPRGPVLAISPFNFPLNLIAHKVAPALAVGATVLLKPPPQAPGAAELLVEIFEKAASEISDAREKIPPAFLQLIHASNDVIARAVEDPRIAILSFTGSDKVGWMLQQKAVRKKVSLELGGNAALIVHSDADLKRAAQRCAFGGFAYAGQICISVQRVYAEESVAERFQKFLLEEIAKLKIGDPASEDTQVGPLIDSAAADRVMAWIDEAKKDGAKVLIGGTRSGNVIAPTVLTGVKAHHKVSGEEVFGPVVVLETYREFEDAIAAVNRSRFGLQAGLFTDSAKLIRLATEELEVGGLIVNEIPTYRADNMPYGGVKDSGLGREGLRYAMEEFCERRTVVTWLG